MNNLGQGQTKCTINDRQKDNSNSSRENYRLNIRLSPLTSQRIQKIIVFECHERKLLKYDNGERRM
ncbi:hypothetical protein Lal_00000938 [Lupinus albus]|nr:hypothetical protein Lal_00000938 [Lupinus albus]